MTEIIIPALIVGGVGLVLGFILAVASIVMAVKKDETAEKIERILPGANCGACGFSGCSGYAENLAKGNCKTNLCAPGGNTVAIQIANVLGADAEEVIERVAVVKCSGICSNVEDRIDYKGIESCTAAAQLSGGKSNCRFGCIGFGDCLKSCDAGAISICNGVAVVDRTLCGGCTSCVSVCPKGIIEMVPKAEKKSVVFCSNTDKGAVKRQICKASCIGCKICEKKCEQGAITVTNFLASVDVSKCNACGACVDACPRKIISIV